MAAGDVIGDAGKTIVAMRNQELLKRTYGTKRQVLLPACANRSMRRSGKWRKMFASRRLAAYRFSKRATLLRTSSC